MSFVRLSLGLVFCLCLVSESVARSQFQGLGSQRDEEVVLEEVQGLLRNVQSLLDPSLNQTEGSPPPGCRCCGHQCTCCQQIKVPSIKFNKRCCVKAVYLKKNFAFLITVKVGCRIIFSKRFSVKRPTPICVKAPFITKGSSICAAMTNIKFSGCVVSSCVQFEVRRCGCVVSRYRLGCFSIRYGDTIEPPANQLEQLASYDDGHQDEKPVNELEPTSQDCSNCVDDQPGVRSPPSDEDEGVLLMEDIEPAVADLNFNQL